MVNKYSRNIFTAIGFIKYNLFDFYMYPVPVVRRGYDYMEVGTDHLGLHVFSKPVVPLIA